MNLIRLLIELIKELRLVSQQIDKQGEVLVHIRKDQFHSQWEILELTHEVHKELKAIRFLVGEIRVAMPLIREIHTAVVPNPVVKIILSSETGETMADLKVGDTKHLNAAFLDEDGAPTIPKDTPAWQATDVTNFSLVVATDSATADLTATGASGNTDDISVSVDGITSNVLTYTLVEAPPPPPKPVASIVLTESA